MYCHIPEFLRCCFFLPLRYGLIAYACMKMLAVISVTVVNIEDLSMFIFRDSIVTVAVIMLFIDIVFTSVFIFGASAKMPKLLLVYMWYCIVSPVSIISLRVSFYVKLIKLNDSLRLHEIQALEREVAWLLVLILFQVYIVFAIRSEAVKLNKKSEAAVRYRAKGDPAPTV